MSTFDNDLEKLSSAEDFFAYFGINYAPQIVAASRLHILKKFHDNLATVIGLESLPDTEKHAVYREQLSSAYARFITGTALTERVFPKMMPVKGAFVALSSLQRLHKANTESIES